MTLIQKQNGIDRNIPEVYQVENGVVRAITEIIQVQAGVLTTRFSGDAGVEFVTGDAGISFTVSRPGLVSLSNTAGILKGTNYVNGQNLGTVTVDTTRTLTGSITVPDTSMWTNRGEDITITGISTTQPGPYVPPPPADRNRYDYTFYDTINPFTTTVTGASFTQDCTTVTDKYIKEQTCSTTTTTTGYTPRYTTVCIAADGCDLPNGSIVNGGVVSNSSSTNSCGSCNNTSTLNPNYVGDPFSITDVAQFISVRIVPETGAVVAISNNSIVSVALATGQQTSYPVLSAGDDPVIRTINLVLSGTIPSGFQGAGNAYSFNYSVGASQRAPSVQPPVVSAVIGYQTAGFSWEERYPTNGSFISITDFPSGGQYLVYGESTNGGAVTGDRGFFSGSTAGRSHTLTATNTAGSDSITFTVITNTV